VAEKCLIFGNVGRKYNAAARWEVLVCEWF